MKLISLNLQGGLIYGPMMEFIKKYSSDTDIFCFQEVFNNATAIRPILGNARPKLFSELNSLLLNFNGYYSTPVEHDVGGLAIFIKKTFVVTRINDVIIFPELNKTENENDANYFSMGRNLQFIEFYYSEKKYTIFNFHGMWIAKGKLDSDRRIEQSRRIRKFFDESIGAKILCTDLNVKPNTKSLGILKEGNRDLIQEYGVTSTRSSLKNRPEIVDYVITSPEVEVERFEVLKDEVSDHLQLLMEFN